MGVPRRGRRLGDVAERRGSLRPDRSFWPDRPLRSGRTHSLHHADVHLRCPDLIMSAPAEVHIDRTTISGHVLLRATSSINNRGIGPLEIRAAGPDRTAWSVYQAIYDRPGRRHLFRTAAKLVFKYVPGERYEYGNAGAFSYWKLQHAAASSSGHSMYTSDALSSCAQVRRSTTACGT